MNSIEKQIRFQTEVGRKIIHIDMDAFYASIEQLDNPELFGIPVIVGGRPGSRGVVASCSYEARAYGIRSAMPCSHAVNKCPEAVFIKPRMARYRDISNRIMSIFHRYTDLVEPLSLDEAYLDVTCNHVSESSATRLAERIRQDIRQETGLTASAGVSFNKFIAKIASGRCKPNGVCVITPDMAHHFLAELKIGSFFGVGEVTERKMIQLGIANGSDLLACPLAQLQHHFGKRGSYYYHMVRGEDDRPVQPSRERKSIGAERTFSEDIIDPGKLQEMLVNLIDRITHSLANKNTSCRTVTLKVRYANFQTITRSTTSRTPLASAADLFSAVMPLLNLTDAGRRKIRLLGVSASNLLPTYSQRATQLRLPFAG